jgi:hypothetical protein
MKKKLNFKIVVLALLALAVLVGVGILVSDLIFMSGKTFETGHCVMTEGGMCVWVGEDGQPVVLHDQSDDGNLFAEVTSGDTIRFVRDEAIMESYPAQVNVYRCWKTAEGTLEDIPQETLDNLARTGWIPVE